jgi:hypothetical protein
VEGGDGGAVDEEPPGVAQQGGRHRLVQRNGTGELLSVPRVVVWDTRRAIGISDGEVRRMGFCHVCLASWAGVVIIELFRDWA